MTSEAIKVVPWVQWFLLPVLKVHIPDCQIVQILTGLFRVHEEVQIPYRILGGQKLAR